jgi:dihydroorotate dehydrogenase electron transfer subunit
MRRTLARIESLVLSPLGRPGVRLQVPPAAIPAPGQAVLGCRPDGDDPFRLPLLPFDLHADGLSALIPEGATWQPGEHLDLLGPVGRGFRPPAARRRWLLAAFGVSPEVLLPVLTIGVERGVGLAMYADSPVPTLPPQVEVSPDLDSALDWADYACLAVTAEWLERSDLVALSLQTARAARLAEILVVLPMPCGTGVCGACAVGRGRAARCACTEGPVFSLEDLVR